MDGDRLAVLWVDFAARLAISTCSCRTNVLAFWPERAGARGRGRGGAHEPAGVSVGSGHSLGRAYTLDVDIRSPRFDVGYIIRRSEYAPSGFEREEREGRRAGRCARGGYSNGPTLVWKCARCKDDGGIRREPRRGDITSR
ncbi:hypothetical protein ALC57_13090 [Trachymyrmex cornetzi]|uniref:Uncharacterized protein n=1 Tax=Trachymyrmex cornetzi TaxID=471704 RepID=A0A195DPA5_9HYME|nr:hypothetical protein ALC57_13090 [Trachymyrmex cornetzi]